MSTRRYSRSALLLLKKETTEQTDATPVAGTNAYLVKNLSLKPLEGATVENAYYRGYFGVNPQIRVSSYAMVDFELDFAGFPGDTAGTAAPWEDALLCCGFQQKALMATAVTGTAQTGGSTTTIKLAAGASATDNYYNGMLITITAGTNSGYSGVIIDYVGSTKIATLHKAGGSAFDSTSAYSIAKASVYEPVTTPSPSATLYYLLDGVRHILLGARGTVSWDLSANGLPVMKMSYTGLDGTISDQAMPAGVFTAFASPSPLLTANVVGYLGGKEMNGGTLGIQASKLTLDMGNEVSYLQRLGAAGVIFSGRSPKGAVSIEATTQTFKDWFADVKNLTQGPCFLRNGNAAGNYTTLFMPKAQLAGGNYSDDTGIVMQDFDLIANPEIGNDEVRVVIQ